jgi:hypothetical protein
MKRIVFVTLVALAGTFSGHAQTACSKAPDMPANARPAWPTGSYTSYQVPGCAPCYTYVNKHGLKIMECPYLRFPSEDSTKMMEAGMQQALGDNNIAAEKSNSYTGNYPKTCKPYPGMPKMRNLHGPKAPTSQP